MSDLSHLSDDELMGMVKKPKSVGDMSDDDLKAALGPQLSLGDKAADVAKSGGIGLAKGVLGLGGLVGDLSNAGAKGIQAATDYVDNALGVTPNHPAAARQERSVLNYIPTSESLQKNVEGVTGPFYQPKTGMGQVAETVGSFVPGAVLSPGSTMANITRYAVLPGVATEAAGKALEGSNWQNAGKAAAGVVASMVNPARVVNPIPISPMRAGHLDTLAGEGVTSLTAGQKTGNEALRYLESASSSAPMAGGAAHRVQDEGLHQFTYAALSRAGAGGLATPETLLNNNQRLGNQFQQLAARNNLVPDNQFINDVTDAARNYRRVPDSQQRAMVQGYIDDIIPHVNAGSMPGPHYQEMRSRLSRQANSLRQSDPTLSEALRDMRNALDSAMARSISPEDAQAWQTARSEYGAQKVLEKSASRAGEQTAEGIITPQNLRNTVAGENRGAYARGQGDFSDLARAGASVMAPLPNSGTAQRHNAFDLLKLANQATLGIVPALSGRVLMSHPVQSYLASELPGQPTMARALMNGALADSPAARNLLMIEMLQRSQQAQ